MTVVLETDITTNISTMDSNITEVARESSNIQEIYQFELMLPLIYTALGFVLLSIASNSFTLVVLNRGEIFHEIDLILYRLLAVEDMITSVITLTSFVLYATSDFTVGIPFFWYCGIPFFHQTIFAVLSISICRYLMIVRPLHYPIWVTRKRVIVSQAILFVTSFVLSHLLKLMAEWIDKSFTEGWTPFVGTYLILMTIGFPVQVFTGSHILYISVVQSRHLQRGERAMFRQELRRNENRDAGNPDNPEIVQERKRSLPVSFKGLQTVLVIIGSYWIAWFPLFLNSFNEIGLLELPDWFRILANATILVNSSWNPLIYYLTNRAFREAAKRTMRRMKSRMCQICKTQTVHVVE